jgi:uncharacterized protein
MTNLKKIALGCRIAASIAFAGPVWAAETQEAPAAPPPPAEAAVDAAPALWKVADEDTTIWLFGTVHILPKGIQWFDGPVETAFDGADTLVTEIVEPAPEEMQKLVMGYAMRDDGKSLRDTLTPEQAEAYMQAMTGLGMPPQAFDQFDAWFAAITLGIIPVMKAGYTPENGVDKQIIDKAKAKGLKHDALETAEFQFGIFESLSAEEQKRYLMEVVKLIPEVKDQIDGMVEAWTKGDAETLAALMNDDTSSPALREALLTNRNRTWAKWIDARLDQPGNVFIAVGAGHLAGADSVQQLLEAQGIEAERVQ